MIYKFKKFLLEYKNRYSGSERIEDFADLYIERIAENLNVKLIKKLGNGYYGIAYLVNNDKVIKVTTDYQESENAKNLIGKKNKHFLNYYDVFEMTLKDSSENKQIYYILMDYIRPLNSKEKSIRWNLYFQQDTDSYIKKLFSNIIEDENIKDEYILKFIKDIISQRSEIFSEAEKLGIEFSDAHKNNLGIKKDGSLVYFDIGADDFVYGNNKKIETREFENDFKKIRNLIVNKYESNTPIEINSLVNDISKLLNVNKIKAWKYLRDEIYYQYHKNLGKIRNLYIIDKTSGEILDSITTNLNDCVLIYKNNY